MTTPDASAEVSQLSDAERKLIEASRAAKFLILRPGSIDLNDELHDPAAGSLWTGEQTIRAEVLVGLLTARLQSATGPARYVMLRGARVTGSLDLMGVALSCPLWLWDCYIEQPVNLNDATAPTVRFPGCHLPLLAADGLRTDGDLVLSDHFTAKDEILLLRAQIGGDLRLDGARITGLRADGLTVGKSIYCDNGFSAHGEVRMAGAQVGGQVTFGGATLMNPGATALSAEGISVEHGMFFLDDFTAQGEVSLAGAHIGGQLALNGASITSTGGSALDASRITVDDAMSCAEGFRAQGEVSLLGAHIGGQLNFHGATLANPDGRALTAEGATVGQSMICRSGFRAEGEVRLTGAHISGSLDLDSAHLANPHGEALNAEMLTVDREIACGDGFTAHGEMHLAYARVRGRLDCIGATFSNPGGVALYMEHAHVATMLMMPASSPDGLVSLINAHVSTYVDDPVSWPTMIELRGFVYDTLLNPSVTVKERLDWVRRNMSGYTPQIYDQLATVYRQAGQEEAARKVTVAKRRRRRCALNPAAKLADLIADVTVGYGYQTWKAAVWLAVLIPLSAWAFTWIHMVPTVQHPAGFNSVGYALDVLIPIADLGLKSEWQPGGDYLYLSWLLRGVGWILATAVIAAVTGVLKRD